MLKKYRKTLLLIALAAVVALAVFAPAPNEPVAPVRTRESSGPAKSNAGVVDAGANKEKGGRSLLNDMPERSILSTMKGELFGTRSWEPPAPKVVTTPAGPPPPPPPPQMTYRFAGRLVQDGKMQFFVSKGDTPVPVKAGDTLDGYVVESISANAISLVYPPLGHKESIVVPPAIPGEGSAAPLVGAAALQSPVPVVAPTPKVPTMSPPAAAGPPAQPVPKPAAGIKPNPIPPIKPKP